jgi:hypothetical protein
MRNRLRDSAGTLGVLPAALLSVAAILVACAAGIAVGSSGAATPDTSTIGLTTTVGDLVQFGPGLGDQVPEAPTQDPPGPAILPVAPAVCQAGSHPLTGYPDGRVPEAAIDSPQAQSGWNCNLTEVAHQGTAGGYKTFMYTDSHGNVCAYYDTALLYPLNAFQVGGSSQGVVVLNMNNTADPIQTDDLTALPMLSPHESLVLNVKRGLLAAVNGNPATEPGEFAIYSLSQDCQHPVLDYAGVEAPLGHESGFSPDGNTFYATATSFPSITAINVSDPKHPYDLWQGDIYSHGMSISDDGDTAYVADPINGDLVLLNVSQIQNRDPNPKVTEISRMTWTSSTIPQNALPFTSRGRQYVLEFDEFAFSESKKEPPNTVGGARIIDITDPAHPFVVSLLRLQINQPAAHAAADSDPGAVSPVQGYASHYCSISSEIDPVLAACSFISSGLRIFNISNVLHPKEVAYYIAPPKAASENGAEASDFTLNKPAFDPQEREVWYTDGTSGFYVLRLDKSVWPDPLGTITPTTCVSPAGKLSGAWLGQLYLGETRKAARTTFDRYSTRGRRDFDFYCLSGGGLRAGYLHGRIALALTSDHFYALDGVRPGTSLAAARRKLTIVGRGYYVGRNVWYVVRGSGVLKVRHGEVQEIGVAQRSLDSTRTRARRFFRSFGQ